MPLTEKTPGILHPELYLEKQIAPAIKSNKMHAEVVWTYIVARKFRESLDEFIETLCGSKEVLPENPKMWLEVYLAPSRVWEEEQNCWRSRADLAVGCLDPVPDKEAEVRSNGDWICIAESKWFDDLHPNSKYPEILQLSQLIEHAVLLRDKEGHYPERVYFTLITPKYFKDNKGPFSKRKYWDKYYEYKADINNIIRDLRLCQIPFSEHDEDTLIKRVSALELNWITFEELLGLEDLVEHHIPGKYRCTFSTWKEVFDEMDSRDLFLEIINNA